MNATTLTPFLFFQLFLEVVRGSLPAEPLQPTRRPDIEVATTAPRQFQNLLCFVSSHATTFATDKFLLSKLPPMASKEGAQSVINTSQQAWLGSR